MNEFSEAKEWIYKLARELMEYHGDAVPPQLATDAMKWLKEIDKEQQRKQAIRNLTGSHEYHVYMQSMGFGKSRLSSGPYPTLVAAEAETDRCRKLFPSAYFYVMGGAVGSESRRFEI